MIVKSNIDDSFSETRIYDLSEQYSKFVPFTTNNIYPIHNWYRFKEGFSRDLVNLIIGSLGLNSPICLDPFAGSGTTPLASQEVGIICHSIEVNPFLFHLAKVKLHTNYSIEDFDKSLNIIRKTLKVCLHNDFEEPIMSTITKIKPEKN